MGELGELGELGEQGKLGEQGELGHPRTDKGNRQTAKENVPYRSGCCCQTLRIRDNSCRMCLGLIRINAIHNNFVIFFR